MNSKLVFVCLFFRSKNSSNDNIYQENFNSENLMRIVTVKIYYMSRLQSMAVFDEISSVQDKI